MTAQKIESLQQVAGGVSRETAERMLALEACFSKWAARINLVAPSTLSDAWNRHVLDSAQLWRLRSSAKAWMDLGSGSGFPGLTVAVLGREEGHQVTLVESNLKKAAYLRSAAAELELKVDVSTKRVEDLDWAGGARPLITARAFAPLSRILHWTNGFGSSTTRALLHKGRGYQDEIMEVRDLWHFDLVEHRSLIEADSVILDISNVRRA
jgi:16S rRNA (guanine527-N7)-methyltransferase